MSTTPIILQGTIKADGTLELSEKLNLPPGQVRIIVEPILSGTVSRPGLLEVMQQIRDSQAARGYRGRTLEEMQAEEAAKRAEEDEEEQYWRAIHAQTQHPLPPEDQS